jgi:hypothetical protein
LEISEPTTIQDFNAYKQEFEQRFPESTWTSRQRSGRFWFNWIFGSMISFKYGDDVAKTVYDYFDHLNRLDRGSHMNLPTLYNHLEHYKKVLTSSGVLKTLRKESGIPSMMRRWLRSSRLAWMMESWLTGRGLT